MDKPKVDKTMRIGILTDNFSKLNHITRKLKNAEFNLKHLKKIPAIDHEIDVLVTDEIVKNCLTPHVVPGNLEILELKIRCAFYQKNCVLVKQTTKRSARAPARALILINITLFLVNTHRF